MRRTGVLAFGIGVLAIAARADAADVLVLGDGWHDAEISAALTDAGHSVTTIAQYWHWDGVTPSLDDVDVVVLLPAATFNPDLQAEADTALAEFLAEGGGLVVTEWAARAVAHDNGIDVIQDVLPIRTPRTNSGSAATWSVVDPSHPITQGLPEPWLDGAGFSFGHARPGGVVLVEEFYSGWPLVTCSSRSGGMVTHINNDLGITSGSIHPNVITLIENAVSFSSTWTPTDCDGNGVGDALQIAQGLNLDVNGNGILDTCETDCNDNGIPDDVDIDAAEVTEIARGGGALDWIRYVDDGDSPIVDLPFPFTIGSETYTAFLQDSNGYVELLRDGDSEDAPGYGDIEDLMGGNTFLTVAYDDLNSADFGFFGYRALSGCVVFHWITETYEDGGDSTAELNEFQIAIFPDGRIEWNFGEANYLGNGYGLFTGAYLGHGDDTLIEVTSGTIPANASWELLPGETTPVSATPHFMVYGRPYLDWSESSESATSPVFDLPFAVTMGGETFTRFVQDANGYVELLRDGDPAYAYGYGSVEDLTLFGDPLHTYLMAGYDDLSSAERGFFGCRLEATCVIFHWTTETYTDVDYGLINSFEMMLWDDGHVTWQFGASNHLYNDEDLFTGVFCGFGVDALFEVARGTLPAFTGYRWDAAGGIGGGSLDQNGNGIPDECDVDGDINGDGQIDVSDLLALFGSWGLCDGCPADLNGDGMVDVDDLITVLSNWS